MRDAALDRGTVMTDPTIKLELLVLSIAEILFLAKYKGIFVHLLTYEYRFQMAYLIVN